MSEENKLPEGWVWTSIESIAEIVTGTTPPKIEPDNFGDEIPFVKPGDLDANGPIISATEYLSKKGLLKSRVIPMGSIMVTCIGSIGKVGLSGGNLVTNQQINSMIIFEPIEPKYVYYYCLTYFFQDQMKLRVSATTVSILNKSKFSDLPMLLAPLAVQQRIVFAIEQQFTRLDVGVAALRKAQAKLKRYRAAVLKAAVEGKLTESWRAEHPTTESASILLEHILKERRAKWEDDLRAKGKDPAKVKYVEPAKPDVEGLPELPEGWCWTTFEQISERVTVGHVGLMQDEYIDNGIAFLRNQNVRPNYFDPIGLKFISKEFHRKLAKSALEPGDILVVRSGSVGVACVMPNIYEEANCSDLVIVKKPISVNPYYAAYYMNSTAQDRVRAKQVGIALTHFNTKSMAAMPLPLPPLVEQEQIASEVDGRLSVITQLETIVEANLKRAERLRQSILKEAFAGRLVPQDPNDEPASVLLEHICMEREGQKKGFVGNGRHAKVSSGPVKIDVEGTRQVELWEGVGG